MEKEYALKKMVIFHCKRGPPGCDRCMELKKKGPKYCILWLPSDRGMVSRPVATFGTPGNEFFVEFEFHKVFDTLEEALEGSKHLKILFTDMT